MILQDTDVVFPLRFVPTLELIRGQDWADYVQHIAGGKSSLLEKTAFLTGILKMSGCATCSSDSFRALRGCVACAKQAIRRYKGSDKELIAQFKSEIHEIEEYLQSRQQINVENDVISQLSGYK